MTQFGGHYSVPKHVHNCRVALAIVVASRLAQVRLAAGSGQAEVGSHGLSEEDGGDVGLRGGGGHHPGTAHLIELREYPQYSTVQYFDGGLPFQ